MSNILTSWFKVMLPYIGSSQEQCWVSIFFHVQVGKGNVIVMDERGGGALWGLRVSFHICHPPTRF